MNHDCIEDELAVNLLECDARFINIAARHLDYLSMMCERLTKGKNSVLCAYRNTFIDLVGREVDACARL